MPITPEIETEIQEIEFVEQPSLTWWRDPDTQRIAGQADGLKAVQQAVETAFHVERFQWQIYTPYFGISWNGLLGKDPGYVGAELQRRVKDALSVDDRILGIENFSYTVNGEVLTAEMTVNTVFGAFAQTVEVVLE